MCLGSTVSLTTLAIKPWDRRPRKCSRESLTWESLSTLEACLTSRLSSRESTMTFGPLEASHSSLMLGFLLERRRWRLVSFILAALCAKVGMPSPQKFVGELAHSVTQELGGNSSHSLICFVHTLSTMPDKKASVKSYNFSSKLNWDGTYSENIFSFVWLLTPREEIFTKILFNLVSKSTLGTELSAWKSKILPKYLKWPPNGTAGIIPLSLKLILGKICWNFWSIMVAPKVRHLSSLMSILAHSHQVSKRRTRL